MTIQRRRANRHSDAFVRSLFTAVPLAVFMCALAAVVVMTIGEGSNESVRLLVLLSLANLVSAVIGSAIAAAMERLWRSRLGRLLVGVAVGVVVGPIVSLPVFGNPLGWETSEWLAAVTTGLLIGGTVGAAFRKGEE